MTFQVEQLNPEVAVVQLNGRFDSSRLDSMQAELLAKNDVKYLIADMTHTSFIDSLGLAMLVNTLKALRARGGDLLIVNPTDVVRLLFELTRMNTIFTIHPSLEQARASLGA